MEKGICIGIIGAGRIGRLHGENIINNVPNSDIRWVCDRYAENLGDWCSSIGVKNHSKDYRDVINDPDVEAVLICSSTNTHARFCIEAAQKGKHIFCEKPVDLDIERIKLVENAVEKAGVKLQVGFNRRYDHNFCRARKLIEEGKIGRPHVIKITSRDPEPPHAEYVKVSGGIFLDMSIHDFDMARFICGSEVKEVYAKGTVLIDEKIGKAGDVDTAAVLLAFENGAIGIIDNSRKAVYGYDQRIEAFGSDGCIEVANDFPNTAVLSNNEAVYRDKPKYFFLERYRQSYIDEIKSFVNCIVNDKKPEVTIKDGLNSLIIGLAAKKSWQEGKCIKI